MNTEPIYEALNLGSSDLSKEKAAAKVKACLEQQVSFAIRHCGNKELVAVRINKIIKASDFGDGPFQCTSPGNFVSRLKNSYNLFKEWNINCIMEFSYLTTRSDFCGRGFATILTTHSIEFARKMLKGTLGDKEFLPPHIKDLKPQAVSSMYTSKFSQNLGMQTLAKIPCTELFYDGKPISEKIADS